MRHTQEALGSPINLRRKEVYEWELDHWNLRELNRLENMLVRRRIETWGWAPDSQLSCVKALQERKRNRAIALDEESRVMNELIRSRFHSGTREPRFEERHSIFFKGEDLDLEREDMVLKQYLSMESPVLEQRRLFLEGQRIGPK
ncbi:uncharacterized protein EAF01_010840 [Botrytis porri]|uniref:Uncharacterized protein n=1 Tax=Botrytis porri TaxID=87229 RepID=A0A4Z1KSQ7_9HELO|nr:uncharacterized protein EAF01_010840 [Botrytis porri]KAF7889347.1 hypothetical protein EAF01_010840 [Botrytis porri]TGO86185.1 hypothetical protein BPOR_0326g00080 [Botrytis porri]